MKKEICKRIKEIRNSLNMNKNEFANYLQITPQYLGTIENGENCLSVEKIILLSEKTNISTDYILLGKKNVLDENLIKKVAQIDGKQLDSCITIIKNVINMIDTQQEITQNM
ncbi:MAG: helix-turn-helix transcriptional regulator [Clostridia bacterium]|nr:helix-turn-helix transcriptional regulator [Clostridia bacterium]